MSGVVDTFSRAEGHPVVWVHGYKDSLGLKSQWEMPPLLMALTVVLPLSLKHHALHSKPASTSPQGRDFVFRTLTKSTNAALILALLSAPENKLLMKLDLHED